MTPRSTTKGLAGGLLLCLAAWLPGSTWAQPRTFAEPTKLGRLEVKVFPQARLDGKDVLLAPGIRIRNESNLLAVPAAIRGEVPVRYRLDPAGQVVEAWILTAEELQIAKEEAGKQAGTR
jgi:hypothetical protein